MDKKSHQGPVRIVDDKGVHPNTLDEIVKEQAAYYGVDISLLKGAKTLVMKAHMSGTTPGILIIDEVTEYRSYDVEAMIERHRVRKINAQRKPQPKWAARNQAPRSPRK